jgi:hypothetical protein
MDELTRSTDDDNVSHVVCECDPDLALCGTDVSEAPWLTDEDQDAECVVCDDLERYPCERCGA